MDRTPQSTRNSTSPSHRRQNQLSRSGGEIYATPSYNVHQSVYVTGGFEETQGLGLIDSGLPTSGVLSQSASIPVSSVSMHPDQYWAVNTPPDQGDLITASYDPAIYAHSMSMPASAPIYALPTRSRFPTVPLHQPHIPIHGLPMASDATYDLVYQSSTMAPSASSHLIYPSSLRPQESSNWYPASVPYTVSPEYSAQEIDQTTPRASEFKTNTPPQRRSSVKREVQRPLTASRSHSVSSASSLHSQAPFLCDVCHKEYARRSTLKAHQKSHGQPREKEFICTLPSKSGETCRAAFHRRTDLKRHARSSIHKDTKDYRCGYNCGVEANRKDTIDRHMRDVCVRGPRYGRKDSESGRVSPISRATSTGESSDEERLDFSRAPSILDEVRDLAYHNERHRSRH